VKHAQDYQRREQAELEGDKELAVHMGVHSNEAYRSAEGAEVYHVPMKKTRLPFALAVCLLWSAAGHTETVGCVTTAWKLFGANHRVCVEAFSDPKVPGVTCHVSQARTGGISGSLGLAEDPSQFSLACRQTGPITLPEKLPDNEVVFSEDTSVLFKETRVIRMWDAKHNTLVYLGISRRLIEGAPANSISTVPVMAWR
jgi:CreA protein